MSYEVMHGLYIYIIHIYSKKKINYNAAEVDFKLGTSENDNNGSLEVVRLVRM